MTDREEPRCAYCGRMGLDLVYGPDPYQEEIHDDDTPVWLCPECRRDSLDAI